MHHRKQTKVLFVLVFFTVALLSYSPLWAQDCTSATPNFTETIIDDYTRVVSACDGTISVYFRDNVADGWGDPVDPQQGEICLCEGADCVDDLQTNVERQNDPDTDWEVDVNCYSIKQAGAGTTGCLVSRNPRTYLIGGDAYTRTY